MINRRNVGLALGMAAAVALTAGALIASTSQVGTTENTPRVINAAPVEPSAISNSIDKL